MSMKTKEILVGSLMTLLTAGICATCGILWKMSGTLTEIKTTVVFLQRDYTRHEERINQNEAKIAELMRAPKYKKD